MKAMFVQDDSFTKKSFTYYNCDAYFTFLSIKTDKIKHHFNKKMWCLEKDLLCVLLTGKMQVWWPFHMKGMIRKGAVSKFLGQSYWY